MTHSLDSDGFGSVWIHSLNSVWIHALINIAENIRYTLDGDNIGC